MNYVSLKLPLLLLLLTCCLITTATASSSPPARLEPVVKGGTWPSNIFLKMYVSGSLAYGINYDGFLDILDVSNLSSIRLLAHYTNEAPIKAVTVVSNTAILANHDAGLTLLNISQPTNPIVIAQYKSVGNVEDVQIVSSKAYIAGSLGISVLDLQNLTNIVTLGSASDGSWPIGLQVLDSKAYVVNFETGLTIWDVSQPTNITLIGRHYMPFCNTIHLQEPYAFVRTFDTIQILDVSNPSNIVEIVGYDRNLFAEDVKTAGDFAFLACGSEGIQVYDISDPTNLVLVARQDTPGHANNLFIAPTGVYVAGYSELTIFPSIPSVCLSLRISDAVRPTYTTQIQSTEAFRSTNSWKTLTTVTSTNNPSYSLDLDVKNPNKFYRLRSF